MFEALSLKKEVVLEREEALRLEIRELDDGDKKRFHEKPLNLAYKLLKTAVQELCNCNISK